MTTNQPERGTQQQKNRRQRAAERKKNYRSPAEQLAYLDKMGFRALKERAKLQAKLAAAKPKPKAPKKKGTNPIVAAIVAMATEGL